MKRLQPSSPALSCAAPSGTGHQRPDREEALPEDRWSDVAELGQGGMGTVRLVRDNWLQRDVAVKEPRSPEAEAQLGREARITAELEHPGIVSVYDVHRAADGHGGLRLVALDGPRRSEHATLDGAPYVRSLTPLEGGRWAVALLNGLPPVVLSVPSLAPVMQLPDLAVRRVVPDGPASFVTATRRVGRWAVTEPALGELHFDAGVAALASDPGGRYLAVATGANVNIIDTITHEVSETFRWQDGFVRTVDVGPDGQGFAFGFGDGRVHTFAPGEPARPVEGLGDGKLERLVAIGAGEVLGLHYSGDVERLGIDRAPELVVAGAVTELAASADRRRVVICGADGQLTCAVRAADGELALRPCGVLPAGLGTPAVHDRLPLLFAPRGDSVETIRVDAWSEAEAGAAPGPTLTYRAPGTDLVTVEASGPWVVGGGRDGPVILWRIGEASPWATVKAHERRAANVVVVPGDRGIATGGWDGRVTFLSPARPRPGTSRSTEAGAADASLYTVAYHMVDNCQPHGRR